MYLTKKLNLLKHNNQNPTNNAPESKDLKLTIDNMAFCFSQLTKGIQAVIQTNSQFMQRLQNKLNNEQVRNSQQIPVNKQGKQILSESVVTNIIKQEHKDLSVQQQAQIKKTQRLMEQRFHMIKAKIPKSLNKNQSERINQILNWVGMVCKKVFSVGFGMLKSGELEVNKVKAYCSQNIIGNILLLSQKHGLTLNQFKSIDKCLKLELLPYFCFKYPQTEERQISKKFTDLLIERDTMNQNQYDYVSKSGVNFDYEESGNYNSQVMLFLNYIISLPNKVLDKNQGNILNQTNIYQNFVNDIQQIFKMVETRQTKNKMLQFQPKQPNKFKITELKQTKQISSNVFQNKNQVQIEKIKKQAQEYKQKVKSYTSYQIGRKISENFKLFSDYEIKSGNIKLTNSTIMRVVTKWCDQLGKNFEQKQFLNRGTPFRMKDGSEKYLKSSLVQLLNRILQRQYKIIQQKLIKLQQNNYFLQSQFSKQNIKKDFVKFSVEQGLVGSFCSSIFKVNQNYLINYLNMLIHGINKALLDFQKIQRILRQDQFRPYGKRIGQNYLAQTFLQNIEYTVYNQLQLLQNKSQALSQTPDLIQFKVGDLLRCKCSSKQQQIIALYKQMQRINISNPSHIRILRVKNKLDQGNKDILMNLLYKDTMLVEMQLAIKSEKSKFLQCSNKFNHYFYQMKRAQFGPIMEMCAIWSSQDARAQFYLDKAIKLNQKKNKNILQQLQCCQIQQNKQLNRLPFKCGLCSRFYYDCSFIQNHTSCLECKNNTCFKCQFQLKDDENKNKLIKNEFNCQVKVDEFKFPKGNQENQPIKKELPKYFPQDGAMIINLKSKQRKILIFKTIFYENEYYLFHDIHKIQQNQSKLQMIAKFKTNKIPQQFLMSNLIFTSNNILQILPDITLKRVKEQYFIPRLLKQAHKTQKKSLYLINKSLTQNVFQVDQQVRQKTWGYVQKLNISDNQFTQIIPIAQKFPNAELVALNNNIVKKFNPQKKLQWKKLRKLYLNYNHLVQIDNVDQLVNLTDLNLAHNRIQILSASLGKLLQLKSLNIYDNSLRKLPQQIFSQLQNLESINFSHNRLRKLPQSLTQLKCIKYMNVSNNGLQALPQKIGQIKSLVTLNISSNGLSMLPDSFSQLRSLQALYIHKNRIQKLPSQVGNIKTLQILQAYQNQIKQLPDSFVQISSLRVLNMSSNGLVKLPALFGKLKQMTILHLVYNGLRELPESFGQLSQLKYIQIQQNQLKQLPKSFGQLKSLETLHIFQNKLQTLPEQFGKLNSLSKLSISGNKLTLLPESFGQLQSLTQLDICSNKIQRLPDSFTLLKSLVSLDIGQNQISSLPQSFGQLKSLTTLRIFMNKLSHLPESFGQLKSLKSLAIFMNNLQQLPDSFKKLKSLVKLHINSNSMKKLFNYNQLYYLEDLEFGWHNNSQILDAIYQLANLKRLKIHCKKQQNKQQLENIQLHFNQIDLQVQFQQIRK